MQLRFDFLQEISTLLYEIDCFGLSVLMLTYIHIYCNALQKVAAEKVVLKLSRALLHFLGLTTFHHRPGQLELLGGTASWRHRFLAAPLLGSEMCAKVVTTNLLS